MKKLLVLLFALIITAAYAEDLGENFGFETGTMAGWTTSDGSGTVKSATSWSSNGTGVNVTTGITNYTPGGGNTWNVTGYGSYLASIQAGSSSPTFDSTTASLGLTTAENTGIKTFLTNQGGNTNPTNASWMKKNVTLEAGKTYVIAWQYVSTDYVPYNDGSMITLTHSTNAGIISTLNNEQKRYALLGFTNTGTGNYSTGSYGSTGWQLVTFTVPENGEYVLGFTSFNLGDTALSPILLVDQLQGTTTKNGEDFGPIAPNAGSTAPESPSGPSYASYITVDQQNRVNSWVTRGNNSSGVYVDQIGNYNNIIVLQKNHKDNYIKYQGSGDNNNVNITQKTDNQTGDGHYLELNNTGNQNIINLTQDNSGGKKMFVDNNGSNNTLNLTQRDSGNHYLDVGTIGNGHNVAVVQEGSGSHAATIKLNNAGGSSTLNLNQSGSTNQVYSIEQTCTTPAGCSATVTQQ